jgi:hypothetical protein
LFRETGSKLSDFFCGVSAHKIRQFGIWVLGKRYTMNSNSQEKENEYADVISGTGIEEE